MNSKKNPNRQLREKLNLTIHPEIRGYADALAARRRRSVSQIFEDLVEAEWLRQQAMAQPQQVAPQYIAQPQQPCCPPQYPVQ
jgi:hypothetical protein